MKTSAKELVKELCKSGRTEGSIIKGQAILDAYYKVLEGKVYNQKEYYYTFKQMSLIHSAMVRTSQGSIAYLYEI